MADEEINKCRETLFDMFKDLDINELETFCMLLRGIKENIGKGELEGITRIRLANILVEKITPVKTCKERVADLLGRSGRRDLLERYKDFFGNPEVKSEVATQGTGGNTSNYNVRKMLIDMLDDLEDRDTKRLKTLLGEHGVKKKNLQNVDSDDLAERMLATFKTESECVMKFKRILQEIPRNDIVGRNKDFFADFE
ncbi:uncharacterized protein LOC102802555 [Saccoglossus kowalevskii]|uniref:Uncharacterized protein LOC102802555 n=1 Tax=Saccoglossus kowalevskii TaxID=10224 RepID=A0ABM0MM04_SACKO|nr:PREDICTED: uncharacterized protein LOC102802555 [Saccoglossus kowalevskii]